MKIFCDLHHLGLFYSLQLLFEKRLGWEVYRPIGLEWYEQGFWNVYDHPDTAKQYLMDGFYPKDHTPPLNAISRKENGIHFVKDTTHNIEQKAITLDQFKGMKFDVVLASIPAHIEPFKKLIHEYQPQAKFIFQMGNMFHEIIQNLHTIPNLLSSTIDIPVPSSSHAIFYHQEFDLNIFKPSGKIPDKQLTSFVNLFPQTNHAPTFYTLKQLLPEYSFKSYGILTEDGIISGVDHISSIMQLSMFGAHMKWAGDGFGHILYNWYASGKPVITSINDYKDKLGGELLTNEETCIDIDGKTPDEVASIIRKYSEEPYYSYMCQQAYKRFVDRVNYDQEEQKIRTWLRSLV